MFCKSCGKEIPENAKFCSGCGTPVVQPPKDAEIPKGEETVWGGAAAPVQPPETGAEAPVNGGPEAAPRDDLTAALEPVAETAVVVAPSPEVQTAAPGQEGKPNAPGAKKKPKLLLFAAIAAVAAIVLVVLLVKLVPSGGGKEVFVYLTDDDELMFRKDLKAKTEPVELTDEDLYGVRFSKNGKYIYFMETDAGDTVSLYRIETAKIGKKDVSPEKVSSGVNRYGIRVLDSGGVVYVRGSGSDGQLRYYDGSESYKLASGVNGSQFRVDEKGAYAYYTEIDDGTLTLYRVQIKKDGNKEKILKDADIIYSAYDADTLVYGKSNGDGGWDDEGTYAVYSQAPGGEKTKLLSNVADVLAISVDGGKVSLVYLTAEVEEHTLYDFVKDALASSDAKEKEPAYSDYQTVNQYGWTTTNWDAYEAAYDKWREAENRNYIRQSLKETEYNVVTYNLSRYENGKETSLAVGLAFRPTYSVPEGIYLYAKSEQEISAVCDVQDLSYWGEVYDMMDVAERTWYQNVGGTESKFKLDEDASLGGLSVLNGSEAILTVYEDGEAMVQAYGVGKTSLTFISTVVDDDYRNPTVGKNGSKDALYYFVDVDRNGSAGELMRYADGQKTSVAKDAAQVVILDDSGAVFKMEDVEYNSRQGVTECSLYVVKDGKSERIADEVALYEIAYLGAKRLVYISDGDLYVWNGSSSEKLASDVVSLWVSGQAVRRLYSCS